MGQGREGQREKPGGKQDKGGGKYALVRRGVHSMTETQP